MRISLASASAYPWSSRSLSAMLRVKCGFFIDSPIALLSLTQNRPRQPRHAAGREPMLVPMEIDTHAAAAGNGPGAIEGRCRDMGSPPGIGGVKRTHHASPGQRVGRMRQPDRTPWAAPHAGGTLLRGDQSRSPTLFAFGDRWRRSLEWEAGSRTRQGRSESCSGRGPERCPVPPAGTVPGLDHRAPGRDGGQCARAPGPAPSSDCRA